MIYRLPHRQVIFSRREVCYGVYRLRINGAVAAEAPVRNLPVKVAIVVPWGADVQEEVALAFMGEGKG